MKHITHRLMLCLCLTAACLLLPRLVWAIELPPHSPYPGGIFHLPIQEAEKPVVKLNNHRVMVIASDNTEYANKADWLALVGIPLSTQPGTTELNINGHPLAIKIKDKAYQEQHLTIKNKRKVNPYQSDMDRIIREKNEILGALASWSETDTAVTHLALPTQGPYSSPFGLRRFFNEQPRKPHSGLDIAAPTGTPILAPAAGKVVATGDYFFNGNTVIIDHGHGLTTLYCHMNRIDVELGQTLKAGQQLGTVGATGRVTGPHLHWSVSMNNARVDPILMLSKP